MKLKRKKAVQALPKKPVETTHTCVQCGESNDRYPKHYCSKCLEAHNEWCRKYVLDKVAQGICPNCGRELDSDKHKTCSECRKRMAKLNKERTERRKANHECTACGKILGKKCEDILCPACRKKRTERAAAYYAKKKEV